LTWVFGAPTIIGFVASALFWYLFNHIDKEEYLLSTNDDYHLQHNSNSSLTGEEHNEKSPAAVDAKV
jgi:hypothetical protein